MLVGSAAGAWGCSNGGTRIDCERLKRRRASRIVAATELVLAPGAARRRLRDGDDGAVRPRQRLADGIGRGYVMPLMRAREERRQLEGKQEEESAHEGSDECSNGCGDHGPRSGGYSA
jgi:hypothetical protein